jgi:hypothetical protein
MTTSSTATVEPDQRGRARKRNNNVVVIVPFFSPFLLSAAPKVKPLGGDETIRFLYTF